MRTHVNFTRINEIEAMYGSTFTFTRGLSNTASILLTRVKFPCVRMEKLRDSGIQPLVGMQ